LEDKIKAELESIETSGNVRILYACESGSRAWGFPSQDSDYDVRFLYAYPVEMYLTISHRRDVIQLASGILDISGWDIRKTLNLLRRSNAFLIEWLSSPVVYRAEERALEVLRDLVQVSFSISTVSRSYLSIAKRKLSTIDASGGATIKEYLYAVRCMSCCEWVLERGTPPPVPFDVLISESNVDRPIAEEVERLLSLRKAGSEDATISRVPVLDEYLKGKLESLPKRFPDPVHPPDVEIFNSAFRKIIDFGNGF
jgi:hypothetical protein